MKRQAIRLKTFVVDKILGVHDSPHRIALGVAIGIFVTWTPTIGFQMALTVALSTLFRANKVVGVPLVWISNPATLWMYIPNYILGCHLLGETPSTDVLMASLIKAFGINESSLKERALTLIHTLWDVLAPLMLGSVIIGAVLGAICYLATYKGVQVFQTRRAMASPNADSPSSVTGDDVAFAHQLSSGDKGDESVNDAGKDASIKELSEGTQEENVPSDSEGNASTLQDGEQAFHFAPSMTPSAPTSGATATSIGATQA